MQGGIVDLSGVVHGQAPLEFAPLPAVGHVDDRRAVAARVVGGVDLAGILVPQDCVHVAEVVRADSRRRLGVPIQRMEKGKGWR